MRSGKHENIGEINKERSLYLRDQTTLDYCLSLNNSGMKNGSRQIEIPARKKYCIVS